MEIVLVLAAFVGIILTAIPPLRRRSRGPVRADAGKQWTTTAAARRDRRPAAAGVRTRAGRDTQRAAAAGTGTSTAVASETYDEWDDDLDWEGEATVAAAPPSSPRPESDLDWQMPGELDGGAVAEPDEEPVWEDDEEPVNGSDDGTSMAPDRATRHDDARTDAPGAAEPLTESDWDWEPTVSRAPELAAPTRTRRTSGRKVNPLVLVALYALFGIGVIVIGVNVISGVVADSDPKGTPRPSATTVEPTPEPTPPAASAATSAEARQLQQAFLDQRSALLAQEARAVRSARAAARRAQAARRSARAARRRAAARRAARRRAASAPARTTPPVVPPAPTPNPVAPAPSGGGGGGAGGGGGGGCEFCIG